MVRFKLDESLFAITTSNVGGGGSRKTEPRLSERCLHPLSPVMVVVVAVLVVLVGSIAIAIDIAVTVLAVRKDSFGLAGA